MSDKLPAGVEKIEHLVVLVMENRSFDHFLGALTLEGRDDVDGLRTEPRTAPDRDGKPVPNWLMEGSRWYSGYADPPHDWAAQHASYHGGTNDGFVQQYQKAYPDGHSAGLLPEPAPAAIPMGYYDRSTLPVLYSLADHFTVCDHWFSSVLSSTWPNRKYLMSGLRDSDRDTQIVPGFLGFQTTPFLHTLEAARDPGTRNRCTWRNYFSDLPFLAFWYQFAAFHAPGNFRSILEFVEDCREDTLPTVAFIDPPFSLADDHPSHDVRLGEKFIGLVVDALSNSESWASSALIVLFDENGGFYDHAPPPAAIVPRPSLEPDDRLGFRVPALVISPYAKRGQTCRTTFDHTSVMKSVHTRWSIAFDPAVYGDRWENAADIWRDCFDFAGTPLPAGTYTQPAAEVLAGARPATAGLDWASGSHDLISHPVSALESMIERMFLLPGLKPLDHRASVYSDLAAFERQTVNLKRIGRMVLGLSPDPQQGGQEL